MTAKVKRPGRGWAYACAQLGGAASIAANVAHSFVPPAGAVEGWGPPAGAVISSVFWPAALFAAIEAFSRVAWPDQHRWVWLRFGGLLPVAAVAAVVSYMHLSGLLHSYGAGRFEVFVGPMAVDGLMVIGTAALIATSRVRRTTGTDQVEQVTDLVGPSGDQVATTTELWSRYSDPVAEPVKVELSRDEPVIDSSTDEFVRSMHEPDQVSPGLSHLDPGLRDRDLVGDTWSAAEARDLAAGEPVDQVAARRRSDDELWHAHGDQLCGEWISAGEDGITRYRVEVVTGAARRQAERILARIERTVETQPKEVSR